MRLKSAKEQTRLKIVRHIVDFPIIVIESFIEQIETSSGTAWVDKTMVVMQKSGKDTEVSYLVGPPLGVRIPKAFQPSLDTVELNYTVGSRIHEAHPDVPDNDWYLFVGHPFSRAQVIQQTLKQCMALADTESLASPFTDQLQVYLIENPMTTYLDFPTPGVSFADLFSLTKNPEFNKRFCKAGAECITHRFSHEKLRSTCIVGLESRGLMLGYGIAAASGLAFVPARKPGKLPGLVEREEYEKEYGVDVIEMQKDHVKNFDTAIIVDDVIATGGSMIAACNLCERLGLEVGLIIALDDIKPLRRQWKQKLWAYNVQVLSGPTHSENLISE